MEKELTAVNSLIDQVTEFAVAYGFQILGAVIILLIGFKIAKWVSNLVLALCERKNLDVTLAKFFANVVKLLVLAFVVIIAMGKFGITIAPFIAALGAIAFGSSLALQGPLSNYGAGLGIILSRPFVVGNTIKVQGVTGVVTEIRLAATFLSNEDGETIIIPNSQVAGQILHNSYAYTLVEASVGIAYSEDPQRAIGLLNEVLKQHDSVAQEPSAQIGIAEFADSSINIGLRYWVPTTRLFQTRYEVNNAIHAALQKAGVQIPFPQREVRLLDRQ
jgi:small conductance mechanosensitive channel